MTKEELIEAGNELVGGSIEDLPIHKLERLLTITQYVTDVGINELERRGELSMYMGSPVFPYICEYTVETVLTR